MLVTIIKKMEHYEFYCENEGFMGSCDLNELDKTKKEIKDKYKCLQIEFNMV